MTIDKFLVGGKIRASEDLIELEKDTVAEIVFIASDRPEGASWIQVRFADPASGYWIKARILEEEFGQLEEVREVVK